MTLYEVAERLIGEIRERPGAGTEPFIAWCHESTLGPDTPDEVPWCSSFINRLAWLCRLPRSKSAAARSWLVVGAPVTLGDAQPAANDIVVLKRGTGDQPGPEVLDAPGHVGIFMGVHGSGATIQVLGGNQGNTVSVEQFPVTSILALRRLESPDA